MPTEIDAFKIIIITILSLLGIPVYFYILTRLMSKAVFKSYFEARKEDSE